MFINKIWWKNIWNKWKEDVKREDFKVSPYALWSVKIENVHFDKLKSLANDVDIEMYGRTNEPRFM